MYRDEILEHFKDPQNFRKIEEPTYTAKEVNPFCGDDIEIFIKAKSHPEQSEGSKRDSSADSLRMTTVEDISFLGKGCAISIAAASLLTEYAKGKTVKDLKEIKEDDMIDLLSIDVSESRKKCALLAFATLHDSLMNA